MKTITLLFGIVFAFATFQPVQAQSDKYQRQIGVKTETIKVSGACGMDKQRIESTALKVEGVKAASWNVNTQVLTITYSIFSKNASDDVQQKIADTGNDTEKYLATEAEYNALPICCHYRKQS